MTTAKRPTRPPTHPGAIWREDILPELGLTVTSAARDLGISRQALHNVLRAENPAAVSPKMALRFARLCGDDVMAGLWIRMQAAYDLWHASQTVRLDAIPVRAGL
jgi:addiction module HigA family antidote